MLLLISSTKEHLKMITEIFDLLSINHMHETHEMENALMIHLCQSYVRNSITILCDRLLQSSLVKVLL